MNNATLIEYLSLSLYCYVSGKKDPQHPTVESKREWDKELLSLAKERVDASLLPCLFGGGMDPDVKLLEDIRMAVFYHLVGKIDPQHPASSSKKEWDSQLIMLARERVNASMTKSEGGIILNIG